MKKLLVIAILMLALVFVIVACDKTPETTDTTVADTTETPTEAPSEDAEETTEAPTEETPSDEETTEAPTEETPTEDPTTEKPEDPTEPPTEEVTTADPADPVWIADPDAIAGVKGANTTAYIADAVVMEEGGYKFVRITVNGGDSQFVVAKDLGTMPKYLAISYRANADKDGEMFIGTANGPNGQNDHQALSWNKDNSWNLMIVDVSAIANVVDGNVGYFRLDPFRDVTDGYIDIEYIAFFNTAEYAAAYAFEMHKAPMWDADKAVISHQSFDELDKYADGAKVEGVFTPGQSGGWDKVVTLNDFSVDALRYWGWIAGVTEQGVFGYQINGGAAIYDEAWTHPEDLMAHAPAGSTYTTRMKIMISLEGLEGENTIRALYKDAAGTEICLNEFTVILPVKPKDITNTFASDLASNAVDTAIDATDLNTFFQFGLNLGDYKTSDSAYKINGISEMFADVNGKYFLKTNFVSSNGNCWSVVRGYRIVNSDEIIEKFDPAGGFYKINNYYETDMAGACGGAGIYARADGTNLTVMIKYYNTETATRVGNKTYTIPAEGTELTMADDGETVYIMVNGTTYMTIALNGSVVYEDINEVSPKNGFAATATVTLADGTTETIENTLIADTCECQVALVVRSGDFLFSSVEVGAFSAIEIPEFETNEPEEPAGENLVIDIANTTAVATDPTWIPNQALLGPHNAASDTTGQIGAINQINNNFLGDTGYGNIIVGGYVSVGEIDLSKFTSVTLLVAGGGAGQTNEAWMTDAEGNKLNAENVTFTAGAAGVEPTQTIRTITLNLDTDYNGEVRFLFTQANVVTVVGITFNA